MKKADERREQESKSTKAEVWQRVPELMEQGERLRAVVRKKLEPITHLSESDTRFRLK